MRYYFYHFVVATSLAMMAAGSVIGFAFWSFFPLMLPWLPGSIASGAAAVTVCFVMLRSNDRLDRLEWQKSQHQSTQRPIVTPVPPVVQPPPGFR